MNKHLFYFHHNFIDFAQLQYHIKRGIYLIYKPIFSPMGSSFALDWASKLFKRDGPSRLLPSRNSSSTKWYVCMSSFLYEEKKNALTPTNRSTITRYKYYFQKLSEMNLRKIKGLFGFKMWFIQFSYSSFYIQIEYKKKTFIFIFDSIC